MEATMRKPPDKQKKPSLSPTGNQKERLGHLEQLALYTAAKRRQEQVATWMQQETPEFVKQAEALNSCGSWLWFHNFFRLNKVLLRGGITCKQHILCATCALRRSAAYAKAYFPVIKHTLDSNPGFAPVLITKTIRNSPDLRGLYNQFTRAHSELMLARRHAMQAKSLRLQTPTIYAAFHGGVGSYEYKRGKNSKDWHPHSHEIGLITLADLEVVPVNEYCWRKINGVMRYVQEVVWKPLALEKQLQEEWKLLTGGSWKCDVRMIGWNEQGQYDEEGLYGAVAEVMGYCLKMQDISPADQVEAYRVLRRRRLTYTLYSGFALFISSLLFFCISSLEEKQGKKRRYWLGLAAVFLFLSLDEAFVLHERLGDYTAQYIKSTGILEASGLLYFPWIIPYSILTIILGLLYFRFILRLPRKTTILLILSAIIFLTGAAGLDMLGGREAELHGYYTVTYIVLFTIEEFLEMIGVVLLIYTLLDYIKQRFGHLCFSLEVQES